MFSRIQVQRRWLACVMVAAATAPARGGSSISVQQLDEFVGCLGGPGAAAPAHCLPFDFHPDGWIDMRDAALVWNNWVPTPVIATDACAEAVLIAGDGLFAFRSTGATTDGLDLTGCAQPGTGSGNIENDVWACWTAPCSGMIFVSTCGLTAVDTKVAVFDGCDICPAPDQHLLACNDDGCGEAVLTSRLQFNAVAGQAYLVRIGNFPGQSDGDGEISIECGAPNCPNPDAGSCSRSSTRPGCNDQACCEATCAFDPFCCTSQWDSNCVLAAAEVCNGLPACSNPQAGACDAAQPEGAAGCNDVACCEAVCTGDAFCCVGTWDDFCADRAASACTINCGTGSGDCNASNGSPGCNNESCCEAVCARDPACCLVDWDRICAEKAAEFCSVRP